MRGNSSKGQSSRKTKAQLSEENDSLRRRVREQEQGHQGLEKGKRPDQLSEALQRIYKDVPIGLCHLDTDLRYLHINDWLAGLNGLSVEDHLGRSIGEVLPHVAAGNESQLRHVIETGKPVLEGTVDAETPAQPGVIRSFKHSFLPIKSDDGAVVGVSCVVEETTERKQIEEALKESEDLLNSIIENVPVGLLIKDPGHIVERANDTYLRWYGFDADTMAGLRSDEIEDFQSAEEVEIMNAQEREVLTAGLTQTRLVERPFTDGQIHTINITKFPVYDQQGKITKVGSVTIDLTNQVQAQKALAHNEGRFRDALESVTDGVVLFDKDERFVLCNNAYRENLDKIQDLLVPGTHVEEIIRTSAIKGISISESNDIEKHVEERLARFRKKEKAVYYYPENQRWFLIHDYKTSDGGTFQVRTNITEQKAAEEALRESEEKHRHFSADVAHELRTPLAVLRSHLDNLEKTETNRSLIQEVDAMSRLVSQLLATTQLDSLTVNPTDKSDLHAIGIEVAKYLAPFAIKEGRSIELTGTQRPVVVRGNDDALEMAVRNLVENALRYSARETVVTIHVSDEPAISVINHGRGILPEQQKVIFQRFKRADQRTGGAGLGLSIVQRVAEAHQATIDVSDAPGGGTVFKISFPSHKILKVAEA